MYLNVKIYDNQVKKQVAQTFYEKYVLYRPLH